MPCIERIFKHNIASPPTTLLEVCLLLVFITCDTTTITVHMKLVNDLIRWDTLQCHEIRLASWQALVMVLSKNGFHMIVISCLLAADSK
jgi:hypothetical protein